MLYQNCKKKTSQISSLLPNGGEVAQLVARRTSHFMTRKNSPRFFLCSWCRRGSNLPSFVLESDTLPTEQPHHSLRWVTDITQEVFQHTCACTYLSNTRQQRVRFNQCSTFWLLYTIHQFIMSFLFLCWDYNWVLHCVLIVQQLCIIDPYSISRASGWTLQVSFSFMYMSLYLTWCCWSWVV